MSAGLGKALCKRLAVELAGLRPHHTKPQAEHDLWLAMVNKVADGAVPMKWSDAFVSSCTNCGGWQSQYEDN